MNNIKLKLCLQCPKHLTTSADFKADVAAF